MRTAREAGWLRRDLLWERLMEAGLAAAARGAAGAARRRFRLAHLLACAGFAPDDLRRASAAANLAILHMAAGRAGRAERYQAQALAVWRGAEDQVAAMAVAPRSRSSLFHLRMEALHRDTYHANLRTRVLRITSEAEETLRSLTAPLPPAHRHAARWRGEKPAVFDGTRKVLGASLLILDR
ncbi:tetratricopeptide repeat-containing protein [Cribrihabitans neustonicus]|uniref:tetratricopeptide repeat-containing protein n=1 Tax=Cribrihabitans neustonicus TaxID=1429085 RepID=UPI003B5A7B93